MVFPGKLFAQPSIHYLDKITSTEGLSSNAVSDIVQDANGYLWIATSYGLNRYDGTEIIKIFSENNNHSLANNKINDLELLDSFHVAIATNHGLSILNTRDNSFKNLYFNENSASAPYDNRLKFVQKDKKGNLWIGSLTCLYRLDTLLRLKKTFHSVYKAEELDKHRIEFIRKIIELKSGNLLFWGESGIGMWDHNSDKLLHLDISPSSPWYFLKNTGSAACFKVYGHYLIIVRKKKLLLYDEETRKISYCDFSADDHESIDFLQKISPLEKGWSAFSFEKKGVAYIRINPGDSASAISFDNTVHFPEITFRKWVKDNEGNWWVTTDGDGVIKISPDKQLFEEKEIINPSTNKQSNFEITGYFPLDNKLFITTYGEGIYEWDFLSGKILHHTFDLHRLFQNIVWNIHYHGADTLWIGTGSGLIVYDLKNHEFTSLKVPHPAMLDNFPITLQYTDSKGLVWIGVGSGHGLCVYNPVSKKFTLYPNQKGYYPFRYPLSIAEDGASNLWFLSDNTHDLAMWNRSTNQFKVIPVFLQNSKRNLPTGNFYLDKKGIIWYGVETFGLVSYNTHTGKVESFGIDKGLNTDIIYNITEDKIHRLWLGTQQGLSVFDPATGQFINYTTKDGLPSGVCSSRFLYDSISERMYTGSPGKVIYFYPKEFVKKTLTMKTAITRILVKGRPYTLSGNKKITLSSEENDISIYFTGINLTNGKDNKYSYQFGNGPSKWIDVDDQRQLSFASLEPGDYHFAIRAARKDGTWSPVTDEFSFIIRPPFTSTAWFYLLVLLLITGSIYAWYRYRLQQVRKLEKMRSEISHDLHDEIGSRLTNISMMSLVAKQHESKNSIAGEWLERIREESQAVSQSMREIVWNINPDNDALDEAFPRMLRYSTDMLEAKGIEVVASVAGLQDIRMDMEKRRDLFLIFKEAVQNILKHAEASNVCISLNLEGPFLVLKITDDGKGFNSANLPFQNGLTYMQQRSAQHHWDFEVRSKEDVGTEIRLGIKTK